MASKGYIVAQIFTASQVLPIENASVMVTRKNGEGDELIGFSLTDSSGETRPIEIETPDLALSLEAGHADPFTVVDIKIEHPMYYPVIVHDAQVFSGTTAAQRTEMVPVANNPEPAADRAREVVITPQNL